MVRSKTIIAIPPGATIKEQLNDRDMSQKEFSMRMGMTQKHISKLINGEVQLTYEVAEKLEMVLGIPSRFWNNLESIYREKIAKANNENAIREDMELAKNYPYNEMSKNKWVPATKDPVTRTFNLRKFFGVARLTYVKDELIPSIACRRLYDSEKADYSLIAWAQQARLEAREIDTEPINISRLTAEISNIRDMTVLPPEEFCQKLRNVLSSCGIAVVFLPHIGGSFLHGATFYDSKKIVVGLTVRGKDADKFWFSLFHELAHILQGHINNTCGTSDNDEKDADTFARTTLISDEDFENFVDKRIFSKNSIINFANKINIAPGIVVGRLQKEAYIQYSHFNNLKSRYTISS